MKNIFLTRRQLELQQEVRKQIQQLRLERGDVLVVSNMETLKMISEMPIHLDFKVPLVFAPGGVKQLKKADLLNLLEQLDQQDTPVLMPLESTTVPL